MKRKRETTVRPSKRQRIETRELVNHLRDEEEDMNANTLFNDSKLATDLAHEDAKLSIKRKFNTLDLDSVEEPKRLALEQRLEYEQGLYTDRMYNLTQELAIKKRKLNIKRQERTISQNIDEKIEEYCDLVEKGISETTWHEIGKFRFLTKRFQILRPTFTPGQQERYEQNLCKLSDKGWFRIHKNIHKNIE